MKDNAHIFRPSKLKNLILLFACLVFVAMGIFLIDVEKVIAWGCIIFFGLGLIVALLNLLPNSSYLVLTSEGFEVKSLFRSKFTKWSEVEDFELIVLSHNKMIGYNYTKAYRKHKTERKISKAFGGKERVLPTAYDIKLEELLDLIQAYKQASQLDAND